MRRRRLTALALTSADRRWFCDGVANYVAFRVLVRAIGENEARRFYDLDAELQKFASVAADVDLQKWPAAENLAKAGYAENLNTANYAFATKAIATICARHGDDLLPRLFAEIEKTPRAKTSMTFNLRCRFCDGQFFQWRAANNGTDVISSAWL